MNRRTRDLITSGTDQTKLEAGGNSTWETPPAVFADLHAQYRFDLDLFADATRALRPAFLGPDSDIAEDSLSVSWDEIGYVGFWNPPYGRYLRRVIEHAITAAKNGFTSVGLIPFRWTQPLRKLVFRSGVCRRVLVPTKRITFYENGKPRLDAKGRPMPALFDSVVVEVGPWHGRRNQTTEWKEWTVPKHV